MFDAGPHDVILETRGAVNRFRGLQQRPWVEFKRRFPTPDAIAARIDALEAGATE
jgi:hypothetical protein